MAHRTCSFPVDPEGHIQQWLAAGLFADLVVPPSPPAEGDLTAGEPWTLYFTRFRRIRVPGYRAQEGAWWLAVCVLRADKEQQATLTVAAPEGTKVCADDGRDWVGAEEGLKGLRLGPRPVLVVVAVPAKTQRQTFSARLECMAPEAVEVLLELDTWAPLRVGRVTGRDVWVRHEGEACPTIWFEAINITGRTLADISVSLVAEEAEIELARKLRLPARTAELFEVPYPADFPADRATLVVTSRGKSIEHDVTLPRTDHDWEIHIVSHFHYDPVWWNTQANYVEFDQRSAFNLIEQYMRVAEKDSDFTFVLEQVPYTKPYWDTFCHRREGLRSLIEQGRCEVVGVLYNEPQTTLTGPEATARNICYGIEYHRRAWGAEPASAWMLDVFGHDPNFAQMLARAGRGQVAYARGPYKRCWGIPADRLGFPVDYWWVSPDGSRVLARLLEPGSYGLGSSLRGYEGPDEAWWELADLFENAADYSAAHLQIWTLGGDFAPPVPWLGELARRWNDRHLSPKVYLSVPQRFFSRLEELARSGEVLLPPLTRDLDPVNNGCDVSYIDTKLANRLCEALLYNAEALATVAAVEAGAPYPHAEIDLAWRQLLFNAHHDALTGSESDQVYVDLLGGWREAYEMATRVMERALQALSAQAQGGEGDGTLTLTVFNTLPWQRSGVVEAKLPEGWDADEVFVECDGQALPAEVVEGLGGRLVRFVCPDVPAMGAKMVTVRAGQGPVGGDLVAQGLVIENEFFRVEVDPARGGGICSLVDKRTGRELVQPGRVANDLVAHKEYPELPGYGEGPWHICTTGEKHAASEEFPAEVTVEETPVRVSLVAESDHVGCRRKMRVTLWTGLPVVEFETHVFNYADEDFFFKVHFPLDVQGGRPVYEVAGPVVSRTYCPGDPDTKQMPWTQDNAANHYVDLTVPLVLEGRAGIEAEVVVRLSAGMAEVVCSPQAAQDKAMDELLAALASVGVTATVTWPEYRRFGDIAWDSNVPDFRIFVGAPEENECVASALQAAGKSVAAELQEWVDNHGWVVALLPDVKLGLPAELPIVVVWGADEQLQREALEHIAAQVREAAKIGGLVPADQRGQGQRPEPADGGVAIVNRGNLSYCCYPDQTLTLSLMRSCTGWPSGLWIDGPKRTCPDGSGFQLEHWGHRFSYALAAHSGHWRDSGLWRLGYEYNRPLVAQWGRAGSKIAGKGDLVAVEPDNVVVTAFKPAETAAGRPHDAVQPGRRVVMRLHEAAGQQATARVRFGWPVGAAWKANLLEEIQEELVVADGAVEVPLGQFEMATVVVELGAGEPVSVAPLADTGAQYARWWRYNRGAAPIGFGPVSVFIGRGQPMTVEAGTNIEVDVVATAGYWTSALDAEVKIEAPEGWDVQPAAWTARLEPDGALRRAVAVRVPADAAGRYLLWARLRGPDGIEVFDVLQVAVGEQPGPVFEAEIEPPVVDVHAGGRLRVRVRNLARSRLAGVVQLVAPVEVWELFERAEHSFEAPASGEVEVEIELRAPVHEIHGWLWALAKVMAAGQVAYTEAVRLDVAAE